jgi:putative hydrolase of the HAD superfamily
LLSFNGITGILFDLDGTLRHSRPSFSQVFFNIASRLGLPLTEENHKCSQRWLHYYWAQSPEMLADRAKYDDQEELFWTNHARLNLVAYGYPPEQATDFAPQVYQYISAEYQPEDYVFPDVFQALGLIQEMGLPMGVLSNRREACNQELADLGLLSYFDFAIVAGEVNSWKPDAEIFRHCLARLGTSPEQTAYVGDNYYADVVGARNADLTPVLLDPEGVFPDADCLVITTMGELCDWLSE